ncbi:hypothetical protein DID88_009079 [Monilinia fructigena]|uniref:Uncharacterized protein n=1 Tax=Monilinia fructigena TaxID=38457 RepID=A0A395IFW4_9HELO|nr:hypothetical protein DID88_009079 [Monilinia fructigena]
MDDKTPYTQRSTEMRETPSPSPLDSNIPSPTSDSKPLKASRRNYEPSTKPTVRRLQTHRASSATNSPIASRESSPVRPPLRTTSAARPDQDLPAINVQRISPTAEPRVEGKSAADNEPEENLLTSGMRTPARGVSGGSSTLETVQEISQPNTPSFELDGAVDRASNGTTTLPTEHDLMDGASIETIKSRPGIVTNESGSESGGKGDSKMKNTTPTTARPGALKSFSGPVLVGRGKPSGEGSAKNMTVETETEGKEEDPKGPSVTSGTASSKADIFEAKVASAVDEANSSDSEETFVYESNPPEQERPRRFHSRTPSATSMASQIDARNGLRSMMDSGGHSVAMKKSMKFANSYNSAGPEMSTEDDGKGTARSNLGRGTAHHHYSRWGRAGGNGHASLFDNESPFPNAAKSKFSANPSRQASRPTSPRVVNSARMSLAGNGNSKRSSPISSAYDLDDAADDERTPLIPSTVRSARSSRIRRGGAVVFMFATTQPLANVKVLALKNILASEQDVIVDLQVMARNPNLVAVTIDSMDMVIFAKSKYAGTDSEWWTQPTGRISWRRGSKQKRDDPIDDPPVDDDPNTNPNLEIGHIYDFESPLIFEGSPFQRVSSVSLGEMRILKPGNQTEPRGSERWGRVLQHEFDLIVRGTLKYTLPLSSKARSIGVEGRATVKPNAADQDPDNVHMGDETHHLFD